MRHLLALVLLAPHAALADHPHPVVVELYTAQGCSACPEADEFLARLSDDPDILPLSLHVDYWDYIGWADTFASPAHTARQEAYARAVGEPMIYTPQVIVGGEDRFIGTHADAILDRLARDPAPSPVALHAMRQPDGVHIFAASDHPIAPVEVHLVRYRPYSRIAVTAGENAGRELHSTNVVTGWAVLGVWDGTAPLDITAPMAGDDAAAVLLQDPGPGPIRAAARVN